jgi:hypothetical protein
MEEVGVGPADLRGDGLERNSLRALFEQQVPGRFECGGSALLGVKASTAY